MRRGSLCRAAALASVAAAWLLFPAAGQGETPSTDLDPAALVRALGDPAESVRFKAMAELMRIGRPASRELAQALLDLAPVANANSSDHDDRAQKVSRSDLAFAVLLQIPAVDVDALLDAYPSAPPEPSGSAEKLTGEPAPPRRRIRMVLERVAVEPDGRVDEMFRGSDPALRISLARAMGRAGAEASEAAPLLAKAVAEDRSAEVRTAAAFALARIPGRGSRALRSLWGHTDPRVRAAALSAYPADEKDCTDLVASSLKDPEREVRWAALERFFRRGEGEQSSLVITSLVSVIFFPARDAEEPSSADLAALWQSLSQVPQDAQPAWTLLARLPGSVLPSLAVLARDADERMRWGAVLALGALAYARRDLAPAIAGTLAAQTSDPVEGVAAASLTQIAMLAELNVVLSAASRKEVVGALVTACLSGQQDCDLIQEILSAQPSWRNAAIAELASHYPDVHSLDDRGVRAFKDLGGITSGSTRLLERLLDHPDEQLRADVATALAERGYDPDRLWDVLTDEARTFAGRDAAHALACLGELGIARLIAISGDPATDQFVREELIDDLAKFATESPQAADFILAAAAGADDPGVRIEAIRALASVKSRPADVRAALEQAFATGDAETRSAVAAAWKETDQAPGDLVERAFADPMPEVRAQTFQLLSALPEDDPRRLAFTAAALQDTDWSVRDEALRFAGGLGEPGAALLAQYAARGEPLTGSFFDGAERLDTLGDDLGKTLEARATDAVSWELDRILSILGRAGAAASEERERLYAQLDATDPEAREVAAQGLLTLREDPWARDGRLSAALMDAGVHELVQERLNAALAMLSSIPLFPGNLGITHLVEHRPPMPHISWPPPPGYRPPAVVPRKLLGATESTTLGDVYARLVASLEAVSHGFEHGLFIGPTGGFALVARMERIKPDGTPLPEPARWMKEGSPKLSLMELLADLFFENPGYFRVIVFAVTSDLVPGKDRRTVLPEPGDGAPRMPEELARLPFKGREVLALVYSFERRRDAKVMPWEDGAPSARQHLEKAGVWSRLGTSARR